jgi:heterodisulfide reductase subunit A-like polyferredoxin
MLFYEKKGRYIIHFQDIPAKRAIMPEISVEERRGNFKEVETGFSEDVAVAEAKRCLSCRRCLGCALCWAECKPGAIDFDLPDKHHVLSVDDIILTAGLERRTAPIAGDFSNKHMNVVTDLQVERMLAPSGPTEGYVLRPQDGELPKSIAFVQPRMMREKTCRNATIVFGINEAILLQRKAEVAVSFISPDIDTFFKDQDKTSAGPLNMTFVNGTVLKAAESGDNKDILLTYTAKGVEKSDTFALVVVLTERLLPETIGDVAKALGVDITYETFLKGRGEVIPTKVPNVKLAHDL